MYCYEQDNTICEPTLLNQMDIPDGHCRNIYLMIYLTTSFLDDHNRPKHITNWDLCSNYQYAAHAIIKNGLVLQVYSINVMVEQIEQNVSSIHVKQQY